jgi:hypothetical protein
MHRRAPLANLITRELSIGEDATDDRGLHEKKMHPLSGMGNEGGVVDA